MLFPNDQLFTIQLELLTYQVVMAIPKIFLCTIIEGISEIQKNVIAREDLKE